MAHDDPRFRSFEEFWPHYVKEHRDARNRRLHLAGTALALVGLLASWRWPWLVLVGIAVAYALAWTGHFAFERNRPATFSHPLWSLRGDLRMFARSVVGRPLVERDEAAGGERG